MRFKILQPLIVALALAAGNASASDPEPTVSTLDDSGLAVSIKSGMTVAQMLELVGRAPDNIEHIGAGCGFLDVARWENSSLVVISVGDAVTSVSLEGK